MKQLAEILEKIDVVEIIGSTDKMISQISFDSRATLPGGLFVAVQGTRVDGHNYIHQAIEKGAKTIVCEKLPEKTDDKLTYIRTNDTAKALGIISHNFYNKPSERLKLVGVTGTNGKTTIVTLLYKLFSELGNKTGLLSTISNVVVDKQYASTHTTADAVALNKTLWEMAKKGCEYCFMEVSSHAIDQKRIAGLKFAGGVFTNLTHDHLDYHVDFKSYLRAKKMFFDYLPKEAFALTNTDDKNGKIMVQNTKAVIKTYSMTHLSDYKAIVLGNTIDGLHLRIDSKEVWFKLTGKFNAYNLLACYATACLLDQDKENVMSVLSNLSGAAGRFEIIKGKNNITGIIDYAHTPDALKNVLSTINQTRSGKEKLITVVGAGGDRDKSKRSVMGSIASQYSDILILTSDNPRTEDPDLIIEDIKKGFEGKAPKRTIAITNRREAIKLAAMMAGKNDIILVAGKGHEKYQEINGVKHPFDDLEILSVLITEKK